MSQTGYKLLTLAKTKYRMNVNSQTNQTNEQKPTSVLEIVKNMLDMAPQFLWFHTLFRQI